MKIHFHEQITAKKLAILSQSLKKHLHTLITTDTNTHSTSFTEGTAKFIPLTELTTFLQRNSGQVCTYEYELIIKERPNACFIFISPCWYRKYERFDAVSAGSTTKEMWKSVVKSVEKVIKSTSYSDCYLWLHNECMDTTGDIAHSLMTVYCAIGLCDLVITPVDTDLVPCWNTDIMSFSEFPCNQWNGSNPFSSLTYPLTHPLARFLILSLLKVIILAHICSVAIPC